MQITVADFIEKNPKIEISKTAHRVSHALKKNDEYY
jgi:hypothetical protein